jgi:hypothetical protein
MAKISWKELGAPTSAGEVRVRGLGLVQISPQNIASANAYKGDVDFELIDVTSLGDDMRKYMLGMMS